MYEFEVSNDYSRRGNKVMVKIVVRGDDIENKAVLDVVAHYEDKRLSVSDITESPFWKLPEGFEIDSIIIENHLNNSDVFEKVSKLLSK